VIFRHGGTTCQVCHWIKHTKGVKKNKLLSSPTC
jgi:hypothetical protein